MCTLDPDVAESAKVIVERIRQALADGVQYFDHSGKLLKTEVEVMETIIREGTVVHYEPIKRSKSWNRN